MCILALTILLSAATTARPSCSATGQLTKCLEVALSTRQMEGCYAAVVERTDKELAAMVSLVRRTALGGSADHKPFRKAQSAWENYPKAECQVVYAHADGGSIRSVLAGACRVDLATRRTHD